MNRPAAGARFVLELDRSDAPDTVYRGLVHLPDVDWEVVVRIGAGGAASAQVGPAGGDQALCTLAKSAAALVKAATKSAAMAGRRPPRKIVRWRG